MDSPGCFPGSATVKGAVTVTFAMSTDEHALAVSFRHVDVQLSEIKVKGFYTVVVQIYIPAAVAKRDHESASSPTLGVSA